MTTEEPWGTQGQVPPARGSGQPGPGWWLASDGNWYPPQSERQPPVHPPPSGGVPPGPSRKKPILKTWWFWVCVVLGFMAVIGLIGVIFPDRTIPNGQTRFVLEDQYENPMDCYIEDDRGLCIAGEDFVSASDCESEPWVTSIPEGTKNFVVLAVVNRTVDFSEPMTLTLTKDGQIYYQLTREVNEPMPSGSCYIVTYSGEYEVNGDDWKESLPPGRYHFEMTSGSDVLSAGDLTVVPSGG